MSSETIWERGAQNERTGLAWQRTTLSGLACGLVVARLLLPVSLLLTLAVGAAALAGTVAMAWLGSQRYARNHQALKASGPLGDARLYLALSAQVGVIGIAALIYAFTR